MTGSGASLLTFFNNIANLITGQVGQAVAILAIAYYGYTMMFGGHDRRHGFACIMGIMFVFGAAWIVGQITGNSTGIGGF
jgi:type IV secretory pathway VirB2 component (pilin)